MCRFCGRDIEPEKVHRQAERSGAASSTQPTPKQIAAAEKRERKVKPIFDDGPGSNLPPKKKTSRATWGCLVLILGLVGLYLIGSPSGGDRTAPSRSSKPASSSPSGKGKFIFPTTTANIRSGPSTSDSVVRKAAAGERLSYVEKKDEWYRLKTPGGHGVEWIHESVVLTSPQKQTQEKLQNLAAKQAKYGDFIDAARRTGLITKVVPGVYPDVYVDPVSWYSMTVDQKNNFAMICALYYDQDEPYMAEIRHGNNGKKLGRWSKRGLKIY